MSLENKTILVTGGCGSFGKRFTEIVLRDHNPKAIRIFDNRELAQVEMAREINSEKLRFFVGDIRDRSRLDRAMKGIDIVVHAAALKHIPICEYNPIEAIKTNIDGTLNVIDAAIDNGVEKVMAISTDKAVYPTNLYGATKMVAEKLIVQGNSYSGHKKTIFSCTRYGNVFASSGSVIPLFKEQAKSGKITLTDEKMTRFWLTLDSGVNFVIKCLDKMAGGEVFIPKIPSMKITDLAEAISPGVEKVNIGTRPGEKLHECLLATEETRHTKEFEDHFIIEPEFNFWYKDNHKNGKNLPEAFQYSSDKNNNWLDRSSIKKLLKDI